MRRALVFVDGAPADVVLGLAGEGQFAGCGTWPGAEAALALMKAGWERARPALAARRDAAEKRSRNAWKGGAS